MTLLDVGMYRKTAIMTCPTYLVEPGAGRAPASGAVITRVMSQLARLAAKHVSAWLILVLAASLSTTVLAAQTLSLGKGDGRVLHFDRAVDSIIVVDEKIADVQLISTKAAYIFGKGVGTTRVTALDARQEILADVRVSVGTGLKGKAVEKAAGHRVVASGQVDDLDEAVAQNALLSGYAAEGVEAVNMMTQQQLPQINLRVRFAEMSRNELLSYGVNWQALFNTGSFSFGLITGGPVSASRGGTNLVNGNFTSNHANIDAVLDALQSDGVLEILAEPNITTVTGRTASFLAGGEIPIPVPVNSEMVGIEYKSYGVSLVFTPTLLPHDRISLQVRPEVSTLSSAGMLEIAGVSVPSFSVRRADTQVEVGSGQTFAIAGLFQRNSSTDVDKFPLLGDIPILGALFRSKRFQRNETELVILITPYLVRPVSEKTTASPLDSSSENPARLMVGSPLGLQGASDFGFYIF